MTVPAPTCVLNRRLLAGALAVALSAFAAAGVANAQQRRSTPQEPPSAVSPTPSIESPAEPTEENRDWDRSPDPGVLVVSHGRESRVRLLGPLVVERGQRVHDAVAVFGSVTVRGDVDGDVVAVGGNVEVEDGASVNGKLVAVGGRLEVAPTARVSPHSERVAIGFPEFSVMNAGEPEFSFRLLPDRTWLAWLALTGSAIRLTALLLLALMAVVLFRPTVDRVADRVAESPGESLVVGIGAQLVLFPAVFALSVGLAITLIGIPLVPLLLLLVGGLWVMGFGAASVAVGRGLARLVGTRRAGVLPAFLLGVLPAMGLTMASRVAWLSGADFGGWALFVALVGALVEGVLWTLGAGAGVLMWLKRHGPAVAAPPPLPPEPPDATALAVQM